MKKIILFLLIPIFSISQNSWNMNLLGTYNYAAANGNDIWGWVDTSGNEYALVGLTTGFSVVNVSNPSNPVEEFFIADINSTWRDIKTWGNYAYVTTEANAGLLIVDLNDMSGNTYWHVNTFTNSNNDSIKFTSAHNIYIDENGVAYIFGAKNGGLPVANRGVVFLDMSSNPTNPVYLGQWNEEYIHDGMSRGDTLYAGCVYQGTLKIIDVSSKSNPITIGTRTTPDAFTHNAWVSDNGDFVFTTDEKSDAFIAAYDITDVNNIQEVDRIQSNPGSLSIPHNAHVDGNFLITSYYRDGTVVHDITYPNNMIEVAYYDSYSGSGNGFDGCWGTYPFLPSGNIISSDRNSNNGQGQLLVYGRDFQQACYLKGNITDCSTSAPISTGSIRIFDISNNLILTENTNLLGNFQTAIINPGSYHVIISSAGYITDTFNVSLSNGVMTILDTILCTPVVCGTPVSSTGGITSSQATLNWNTISGAWGYTVRYKEATASSWTIDTIQPTIPLPNFLILNSLNSGTAYRWQVKAICLPFGMNSSSWSSQTIFTTLVPPPPTIYGCTDPLALNYNPNATIDDSSCIYGSCGAPGLGTSGVLNTGGITTSQATLNWNPIAGAWGYTVRYKEATASSWTIDTIQPTIPLPNFLILNSLNSGTAYRWQVKAICLPFGMNSSSWSSQTIFTTLHTPLIIYGCTDPLALNYNLNANTDDGSCIYPVYGCMDSTAVNYNVLANIDDGSCIYCVYGCMDSIGSINYNPLATCDDGSCIAIIYGCTDSTAINYDPVANIDDSSCIFCSQNFLIFHVGGGTADSEISWGLTQWNGWAAASGDSGVTYGCVPDKCYIFRMYDSAGDGWNGATYTITDDSGVILASGTLLSGNSGSDTIQIGISVPCPIYGCTDSLACNFDSTATIDDGSCLTIYGCMDSLACNYDSTATCDSICNYDSYHPMIWQEFCENTTYTWNGNTYTTSGTYSWTGTNSVGCDSIVTLQLSYSNYCGCDSLTFMYQDLTWGYSFPVTVTSSGTHAIEEWEDPYTGFTSYTYQYITINNSTTSIDSVTSCQYNWNGNTYINSGTYTWTGTNSVGCDSTAILHLTVPPPIIGPTLNHVACDTLFWNGIAYGSSGTYTWTGTSLGGCDSIVTLNLTIDNVDTITNVVTACESFSCQWYDSATWTRYEETFNSSGIYSYIWHDTITPYQYRLCDSIYILDLTIHSKPQTSSILGSTVSSFLATETYNVGQSIGSIFNWNLDSGGIIISGQTTNSIQIQWGNNTGFYDLYVVEIDSNGCIGDTIYLTVNVSSASSIENSMYIPKRELIRIIDVLGRENKEPYNIPLFYIYDDGTVEKRIIIE